MLVTPSPIGLLVVFFELGKITIFAMVFFGIHTIGLVFMAIPFVIFVVLFVVIGANLVLFGSQRCWPYCYRDHQGGAQ